MRAVDLCIEQCVTLTETSESAAAVSRARQMIINKHIYTDLFITAAMMRRRRVTV